jgi:hypothetical protein
MEPLRVPQRLPATLRRMATSYFHVAPMALAAGSIIEPGNYGRVVRLLGPQHRAWDRETALENFRKKHHPTDRPSRLSSVFVFEELAHAQHFKQTEPGFATNFIYRVCLVDQLSPTFRVKMSALRAASLDDIDWPDRYWRQDEAPAGYTTVATNVGMAMVPDLYEVLIGGAIRIEARID